MAPMKKNRNRDRKNVRRRVKNSGRKGHKYSGSADGSRVDRRTKRKITGSKLETTGLRRKRKYQRMGAGRLSKLGKGGNRESSDCESDSRDSEELRAKRYIRKALKFGLASGYLIPVEDSGRRVLRVTSDIVQFAGGSGTERSGSDGRPDASMEGRGRSGRVGRAAGGKRLTVKSGKNEQKNVRKRGRSRTNSPRKPVPQKRRKKRSESRSKPKPRTQKRKRTPEARNEQPSNTVRSGGNDEDGADEDGADDEDDEEPDPDNNEDGDNNSEEKKNKLPGTSRHGSIVPNSDNRTDDGEKITGDDEPSEPSGEERSTEDEEEGDEEEAVLQREEGLEEEDANEVGQEKNVDIE